MTEGSPNDLLRAWFDDQARTFYMLIADKNKQLTVVHYDLSKFVRPAGGETEDRTTEAKNAKASKVGHNDLEGRDSK